MASNNSKSSKQHFAPKGGGWDTRYVNQNNSQRNVEDHRSGKEEHKRAVLNYLSEMFKNVIEPEVVSTVAHQLNFDLHTAVEALVSMSEQLDTTVTRPPLSFDKHPDNFKVDIHKTVPHQKPRLYPPKNMSGPAKYIPANVKCVTGTSQSLRTIKVAYCPPDSGELSDDADVVIEEEKEFEVERVGSERAVPHLSTSFQPVLPASSTFILKAETKLPAAFSKKVPNVLQVPQSPATKECVISSRRAKKNKQPVMPLAHSLQPEKGGELMSKIEERILLRISEGSRVMVMLRGAPGSGKSYLARNLMAKTTGTEFKNHVFSTDDYFSLTNGEYRFSSGELPDAHEWNLGRVKDALKRLVSPVFVDNTNIQAWEMRPYAVLAVNKGYYFEVLEPQTPWKFDMKELARKNIHKVPFNKIREMLDRYENYTSGFQVLSELKLNYKDRNKPPQPASNRIIVPFVGSWSVKATPVKQPQTVVKQRQIPQVPGKYAQATVKPPQPMGKYTEQQLMGVPINVAEGVKKKRIRVRPARRKQEDLATLLANISLDRGTGSQSNHKHENSFLDTLKIFYARQQGKDHKTFNKYVTKTKKAEDHGKSGRNINHNIKEFVAEKKIFKGASPSLENQTATKSAEELGTLIFRQSVTRNTSQRKKSEYSSDSDSNNEEGSPLGSSFESIDNNEDDDEDEGSDSSSTETSDGVGGQDIEGDLNKKGSTGREVSHSCGEDGDEESSTDIIHELLSLLTQQDTEGDSNVDNQTHKAMGKQFDELHSLPAVQPSSFYSDNCEPGQPLEFMLAKESGLVPQKLQCQDVCFLENKNSVNTNTELKPSKDVSLSTEKETLEFENETCAIKDVEDGTSSEQIAKGTAVLQSLNISKESTTSSSSKSYSPGAHASSERKAITLDENEDNCLDIFDTQAGEGAQSPSVAESNSKYSSNLGGSGNIFEDKLNKETSEGNVNLQNNNLTDLREEFTFGFADTKLLPRLDLGSWVGDWYTGTAFVGDMNTKIMSSESGLSNVKPATSGQLDVMKLWEEGGPWDEVTQTGSKVEQQSMIVTGPKPERKPGKYSSSPKKMASAEEEQDWHKSDSELGAHTVPPDWQLWAPVPEPELSWEAQVPSGTNIEQVCGAAQRQSRWNASSRDDTKSDTADTVPPEIHAELPSSVDIEKLSPRQVVCDNQLTSNCSEPGAFVNLSVTDIACEGLSHTQNVQKLVRDSATNTLHTDFTLLDQVNTVPTETTSIVKVGSSRDITDGIGAVTCKNDGKLPVILMLDQSSLVTEEDILLSTKEMNDDGKTDFEQLVSIFSQVSPESLRDVFEKCQRDLQWTIEVLLSSELDSCIGLEPADLNTSSIDRKQSDPPLVSSDEVVLVSQSSVLENAESSSSTPSVSPQKERMKKGVRRDKKDALSEVALQVKKEIESNFVIGDHHYSDHTLRIKRLRQGEPLEKVCLPNTVGGTDVEFINSVIDEDVAGMPAPDQTALAALKAEQLDTRQLFSELEESESELMDGSSEEEEMLPLTLGSDFVSQLHGKFGNLAAAYTEDLPPVANIPLSLARQIYCYLLESQQQHIESQQTVMDRMVKEDEELARALQEEESLSIASKRVPDLQEIMDMEMALAIYRASQAQLQTETKDDLATKLSKQMLCSEFPTVDKKVLFEVFKAHGNSFDETVQVLHLSTGQENKVQHVFSPEALASYESALIKKAQEESLKPVQLPELRRPLVVVSDSSNPQSSEQEMAFENTNYYRSEAEQHQVQRRECMQKAQDAYQRGLTGVAGYYSQVANLHKQRADDANARAASCLLAAHSYGQVSTTLELHYFHVPEALTALDIFLDHHVTYVTEQGKQRRFVFLITGRGKHSVGGLSRIRPAVECRLQQRGLRFCQVNEGLIKVIVTRNSLLSSSLTVAK